MAVNGGGLLSINFASPGFLSRAETSQRAVAGLRPGSTGRADTARYARHGHQPPNAGVAQLHQASVMTDSDGSRRAVVFFPAGTTATMTFANGSTQPMTTMHVRVTEYTVGPNGTDGDAGQPSAIERPIPIASSFRSTRKSPRVQSA
jgi:hypothetical protein